MEHQIKAATAEDRDSILALLPRLAEFKIPKHRAPRELWGGDAKMVKQWADGERDDLDVWVALGVSVTKPATSLNTETTSSAASAVDAADTADVKSSDSAKPSASDAAPVLETTADKTTDVVASVKDASKAADKTASAEEAPPATNSKVIGVSIVSYKPELLSGKPSAHLEVMVVDKSVEGQGVAGSLMKHAQSMASANGAESMSLHVFAANEKARAFYDKQGFDGELMRYSKPLKVKRLQNLFGKYVATSGVARSIKKLLRST